MCAHKEMDLGFRLIYALGVDVASTTSATGRRYWYSSIPSYKRGALHCGAPSRRGIRRLRACAGRGGGSEAWDLDGVSLSRGVHPIYPRIIQPRWSLEFMSCRI